MIEFSEERPMLIAEVGLSHMGNVEIAKDLVERLQGRVDAVKFQVYTTDRLISKERDPERHERFGERELSFTEIRYLKGYTEDLGLRWFASAHTVDWVRILNELGVFAFKVGSGESNDSDVLRECLATGRPVFVSTGLRSQREAVRLVLDNPEIIPFHCVTAYPTQRPNLGFIKALRTFSQHVGYSCHFPGTYACELAAAIGVVAIEKHVRHEASVGQDNHGALFPEEFGALQGRVGYVLGATANQKREFNEEERKNVTWARKAGDGKRPLLS